jgi:hypothetical protein
MIEQFLQTALKFVKEIWFQLDSRFDLENIEAFKFLKPYLILLQDNPLYMGISVVALFLVPYVLIKVKSNSRKRERKLDELMEEMEKEEEYGEDDPRRLRRPEEGEDDPRRLRRPEEPEAITEVDGYTEKPLYGEDDPRRLRRPEEPEAITEVDGYTEKPLLGNDDNDNTPSDIDVLDEIKGNADSTDEGFELDSSPSDNEEITNLEENAEPVSSQLAESEIDKDLNELLFFEENKEPGNIDESSHNQAIKELQEDGELMGLDDHLSGNDPLGDFLELNVNDQDKIIKELQKEKEQTISQSTKQVDEFTESHSPIKDLNQTHIGGDATIDDDYIHKDEQTDEEEFFLDDKTYLDTEKEAPSSPQEEPSPVPELSDSEILDSLEPALEKVLNHETKYEEEPITIPKTSDYDPELAEFTFEAKPMSFEKISEPEVDTPPSPLGETDTLIDRLKFLQTRFENRYQPSELSPESAPSPAHIEKSIAAKDYVNFTEPRRYSSSPASPPPDSEKYMDLLESFVFMKDQKKHK